jgi:hypothetical protein
MSSENKQPPKRAKSPKGVKRPTRPRSTKSARSLVAPASAPIQPSTREVELPDAANSPPLASLPAASAEPTELSPAPSTPTIPFKCDDPCCAACNNTNANTIAEFAKSPPTSVNNSSAKGLFLIVALIICGIALILLYRRSIHLSIRPSIHSFAPVPVPTASIIATVIISPLLPFSKLLPVPVPAPAPTPVIVISPAVAPVTLPALHPLRRHPDNYPHHFICRGGSVVSRYSCGAAK